jgi:putative restriction endonuclease
VQAGVSGSEREGADSIVVSGGYEDDVDYGGLIIYTGHGGRDSRGRQIEDQQFRGGNRALARSCDEGLPVRVVRGSRGDAAHSPHDGYRYDGLFRVEEYWSERGKSGFLIWRYRLVKLSAAVGETAPTSDAVSGPAPRVLGMAQRIVRNTVASRRIKDLYAHACQMCGLTLITPTGPYAEGAHIRPLGEPHDGPDNESNLLCLCPNCHVLFDSGALYIDEALNVMSRLRDDPIRPLLTSPSHAIDSTQLAYHRSLFEVATTDSRPGRA